MSATIYDGPFFAYIHNIRNDNTWRIVIIFASRGVADNWWRAISNATTSSGQSLNIQRVAPQFYTHDPDQRWNVFNFFTDAQVKAISSQFRGLMFFTLENDRGGRGISIIQLQTIVDHTSGSWFTIRSRSEPNKYWYYNPISGRIVLSTVQRSSFKVSAIGQPDGTVMIRQDDIRIWSEKGGFVACLVPNEPLTTTGTEVGPANTFKFDDFTSGKFFVISDSFISFSETPGPARWELSF